MKKLVQEYKEKNQELQGYESRREVLLKELRATEAKLTESNRILHNTELDEASLLRKIWGTRKTDRVLRKFEDAENGNGPANVCDPNCWHGAGLDQLRLEVDAALRGIYPTAEVEKLRVKVEELRRTTKTLEILFTRQIPDEIESIDGAIAGIKAELSRLNQKVWSEAFEKVRQDVHKIALPLIREAFITCNGIDPYFLRWPDARFFFMLFGTTKITIEELLAERETLREKIFKG